MIKQDDYFVIAYRILAYLYECLKEGSDPDRDMISAESLGINERYWSWIIKALYEADRISGGVYDVPGSKYAKISAGEIEITETGIIFLQESSSIERAKRFLAEIKAAVPGM